MLPRSGKIIVAAVSPCNVALLHGPYSCV
jgi:hypothetical protein